MNQDSSKKGFRYQFFQRQYPSWVYAIAIGLFALGVYIWIEYILVITI